MLPVERRPRIVEAMRAAPLVRRSIERDGVRLLVAALGEPQEQAG